jgi:hypothetical protein
MMIAIVSKVRIDRSVLLGGKIARRERYSERLAAAHFRRSNRTLPGRWRNVENSLKINALMAFKLPYTAPMFRVTPILVFPRFFKR